MALKYNSKEIRAQSNIKICPKFNCAREDTENKYVCQGSRLRMYIPITCRDLATTGIAIFRIKNFNVEMQSEIHSSAI